LTILKANTQEQFDSAIGDCRDIFLKKNKDYGPSWRILRSESLTDQIFIKAQRIRSVQENQVQLVEDDLKDDFVGIVNYCFMALINLKYGSSLDDNLEEEDLISKYEEQVNVTKELMIRKNHDYGEAWRDMRIATYVDFILMKILRTRQIEENDGKTIISEGLDANYMDMINYAIFAIIRLKEQE
jgi:hypothetical protein